MDQPLAKRIVTSGTITYIAEASPGTAYTQASWRVQKIDETTATDVKITWAGGTSDFKWLATNIAGLTYV